MRPVTVGVVCALVLVAAIAALSAPARAYVVSTSPADGETDVPLNAPIVVVFSEPQDTSTVTWRITPAITLLPTWSGGDTVLTMVHAAPFAACMRYVAAIDSPPPEYEWTFTTECPAPFVVATVPADGATGVDPAAPVVVTFSEPMDRASVVVFLSPALTLSFSWTAGDTVLTIDHAAPFAECAGYALRVDGTDTDGTPLAAGPAPNPWSFETACTVSIADRMPVYRLGADVPGGESLGVPVPPVGSRERTGTATGSGRGALAP